VYHLHPFLRPDPTARLKKIKLFYGTSDG